MKKRKNIVIVSLLVLAIALIAVGGFVFNFLQDKNIYNVTEKKYIIDNKATRININVANDVNIFGKDGKGVFFDFLEDFKEENGLDFNIVTTKADDNQNGLSLSRSTTLPANNKVMYTDHFVLVGKSRVEVNGMKSITSPIGYLDRDQTIITSGLTDYTMPLKNYEDKASLLKALEDGEVTYILVPMVEYLDIILSNLYTINYHLSDMKDYYYLANTEDTVLASILNKFYNKWESEKQDESFDKNEYDLFIDKLKITEKELDVINNKKYRYGFLDFAPYDIKEGGMYGGALSKYIEGFSKFSGIEFEYDKYASFNKLTRAISKGSVDLFANYYVLNTSMVSIDTLYQYDISFVMNNGDKRVVNNLNAIKDETVYVKENSAIIDILKSLGINTKTFSNDKALKNIFQEDGIVAMEYANYLVYKETSKTANERFRLTTGKTLSFQSNNDTMFNRLFSYYAMTIDKNGILYTGIENYYTTLKSGTLIYKITKYAAAIILAVGLVVWLFYKFSKRAFVRKKIKKSDKMKYIDILTSLKNRNFLSENIPIWNQNTIYPQAVVVIDLNGIQELNDIYGYKEGDKQIQAAANALIKTQLDNSEIMRTDGNEFTVYLVGYSEKQIISYIKKLNKEFKNLPHDKKAAIGFSMIDDDLKLLNDAINEATEKMRENKALTAGEDDVEKD